MNTLVLVADDDQSILEVPNLCALLHTQLLAPHSVTVAYWSLMTRRVPQAANQTAFGVKIMQVGEIMTRQVVTVDLDQTVAMVQQLFAEHQLHHLLVTEHGMLFGIISDRDLLRNMSPFVGSEYKERPQDRALMNRRAHQIMSRRPITVTEETPVPTAARLMLEHTISCLPIVDEKKKPVGIVTMRDLLRVLVASS